MTVSRAPRISYVYDATLVVGSSAPNAGGRVSGQWERGSWAPAARREIFGGWHSANVDPGNDIVAFFSFNVRILQMSPGVI
jgi:hypothetical protein